MGAGGLKPPTPRNSMESRGKKEGEEGERKEGERRKGGAGGRRREMSPPRANGGSTIVYRPRCVALLTCS